MRSLAWSTWMGVAILASLAGCGGRAGDPVDAGMGRRCSVSAECDDGFDCTVDSCGVGNLCAYTPIDAVCTGAGESCVVGVGCTTTTSCTTSAQCDDAIACTVDTCGAAGSCEHQEVDALCTDPMLRSCDAVRGCVAGAMRCTSSAECNDMVGCTVDTCTAAGACERRPIDSMCNTAAGEVCTSTGCMVPMTCTTEEECQDGNFCNGRERCVPELGCAPATMMARCDDMDACTTDTCEPATGCVYACDTSMPACMCGGEINCVGRFMLSPAATNQCIDDGMGGYQVDYDVQLVDIAIVAGMAIVTPVAPSRAHFGTLSDATASCPSLTAVASVSGGVTERYTLDVTFSDSDHFAGSFNANLGGLGGLLGCTEGSMSVSGVRVP